MDQSQNMYASPPPVVEELAPDDAWRGHSRPLVFTAWGMTVTGVGFLMLALLLSMTAVQYIAYLPVPSFWEDLQWFVAAAVVIALALGPVMCLACRNYLVRNGRWMALGFPVLFFVPLILDLMAPPMYRSPLSLVLVAVVYVGHLLWGWLLLRLARALGVRRCRPLVWTAMTLWTLTLMIIAAETLWRNLMDMLDEILPLDMNDTSMLAYLTGAAVCGYATLMLSIAIVRRLQMPRRMENENE